MCVGILFLSGAVLEASIECYCLISKATSGANGSIGFRSFNSEVRSLNYHRHNYDSLSTTI